MIFTPESALEAAAIPEQIVNRNQSYGKIGFGLQEGTEINISGSLPLHRNDDENEGQQLAQGANNPLVRAPGAGGGIATQLALDKERATQIRNETNVIPFTTVRLEKNGAELARGLLVHFHLTGEVDRARQAQQEGRCIFGFQKHQAMINAMNKHLRGKNTKLLKQQKLEEHTSEFDEFKKSLNKTSTGFFDEGTLKELKRELADKKKNLLNMTMVQMLPKGKREEIESEMRSAASNGGSGPDYASILTNPGVRRR